jgi:hypothetical protein
MCWELFAIEEARCYILPLLFTREFPSLVKKIKGLAPDGAADTVPKLSLLFKINIVGE